MKSVDAPMVLVRTRPLLPLLPLLICCCANEIVRDDLWCVVDDVVLCQSEFIVSE